MNPMLKELRKKRDDGSVIEWLWNEGETGQRNLHLDTGKDFQGVYTVMSAMPGHPVYKKIPWICETLNLGVREFDGTTDTQNEKSE